MHVEAYIKAHRVRRLADTGPDDIACYLEEIGRKPDFPDWRFRQVADALRILYTEIIKPKWAEEFNWHTLMHDGRELGSEHGTLTRITDASIIPDKAALDKTKVGVVHQFRLEFPELYDRLVAEMRIRGYSIRTEQTYISWIAK